MNQKTFIITLALVLALVAVAQTSAKPLIATKSTVLPVALMDSNTGRPKVVEVDGGEMSYPSDISDDRNLLGASHDVFVGKVTGEVSSEGWYTKFSVQVISNIKGDLQGVVSVGVTGGYRDGVFYVTRGNTWLAPGSTYLLATRYRSIDDSYRLIGFDDPVSWKLLSENSGLATAQLQTLAHNDLRVKALAAAYPYEVLDQADVYNHSALNSYASVHPTPSAHSMAPRGVAPATPAEIATRDAKRISDLQQVQNDLALYFKKCHYYPGTAQPGSCDPSYQFINSWAALSATIAGSNLGVTSVSNDPTDGMHYFFATNAFGTNYVLGATLEDPNNPALANDLDGSANGIDCADPVYCVKL